ncbi:NADP-dependent oxidoreductase [Aquabacterium sp.]|uniref:NADP-dependent oxidoreductase n=1 Tax=Aquabacterium sp. TaxID=1872578 RepID=UPI002BBC4E1D|nr:NADP-dependent oxidoreductase [Aquabacterium sp.]HSW05242.1 NADP-dependent oxidoreductase [Aquabacterium sp.]
MTHNRQWILRQRPLGAVTEQHLQLRSVQRAIPAAGEVLVRNIYLLVPPAMRLWMNPQDSYVPAQPLGETMMGITLGIVEASNDLALPVGTYVNGMGGCQEWFTATAAQLMPLAPHPQVPLAAYRSVLDVQGLTAWAGLHEVCQPQPGQTLVVTAAAGSVGSLVCQLGTQLGLHVVGIAGGADKCRWLRDECGIAATIDYKAEDVGARLDALCPNGIDRVFENVGGPVLDLLLERINDRARIALCGMVASYNGGGTQSAGALMRLVTKAARMEGFLVRDHFHRYAEVAAKLQALVLEDKLKYRIDILDGLAQLPVALDNLFHGRNLGVQLLRLSPERGA